MGKRDPFNPNLDSSVLICRVPNQDVVHREDRKSPAAATAVDACPPYLGEGVHRSTRLEKVRRKKSPSRWQVSGSLWQSSGRVTKWRREGPVSAVSMAARKRPPANLKRPAGFSGLLQVPSASLMCEQSLGALFPAPLGLVCLASLVDGLVDSA